MKRTILIVLMLCALLLAACSAQQSADAPKAAADTSGATRIALSGNSADCDADTVSVDGGVITITGAGQYELTGTLDNGMVIVSAGDDDDVELILNGARITSAASAAIYVIDSHDITITLADGSENHLENGGAFTAIDESNIDGVIFSKEDLTLAGGGSLEIASPAGHGVVSKDDLVITDGVYSITAASHGVTAKDDAVISGGDFTISAGKDGLHIDNDEDESLGNLTVTGGTFAIAAEGDGVSASGRLDVSGGEWNIAAGGGADSVTHTDEGFGWQGQTESTDSVSAKGMKAGGSFTVSGGTITIDSADDSLHANGDLTVTGGAVRLSSGDDGIHADDTLTISDGSAVTVTKSYEGLEGQVIDIAGGEIDITASDDGMNAAGGSDQSGMGGFFGGMGGNPFDTDADAALNISGGTITVNAEGDGLDSNGALNISGGTIRVSGPTNGGNGAIDYGTSAAITGGTIIAAGASGMAENFTDAENQGAMLVSTGSQSGGTAVTLKDENGNVLLTWTPEKPYECVIISCPEIQQGSTYTVEAGSSAQQIAMTSAVYGAGSGMGMPGGGMNGQMPGGMNQPGGQMGQPGQRPGGQGQMGGPGRP